MIRGLQKLSLSACAKGAALLLLFFLFSGSIASAGSYVVAYGFDDTDDGEVGKLVCGYEEYCDLKLKKGGIVLTLHYPDPHSRLVYIDIHRTNWGPGCCYFDGGASYVKRDATSRISLNVFFGRPRKWLEYVENMRFGVLDLIITETK